MFSSIHNFILITLYFFASHKKVKGNLYNTIEVNKSRIKAFELAKAQQEDYNFAAKMRLERSNRFSMFTPLHL